MGASGQGPQTGGSDATCMGRDAKHCNNFFFSSVYSLYCLLKLRIICLKIVIYEYLRKNMIKKSNILPYTHLNYHMFISM